MELEERGAKRAGSTWRAKNEDRITMLETRGSGESIVLASVNTDSYVGEWGKDRSRGWPVLGYVKQKEVLMVLPHTQKLLVFIGSSLPNRSDAGHRARREAARQRADKWGSRPWAQRYRHQWQR